MKQKILSAAFCAGLMLTGAMAFQVHAEEESRQPSPQIGAVCFWALTASAEQVGKRCPGKFDPEFQPALEQSVARLDRLMMDRAGLDMASVAKFKRQQAGTELPDTQICSGDRARMFDSFHREGAKTLIATTDKVLAQPGAPEWGDCL